MVPTAQAGHETSRISEESGERGTVALVLDEAGDVEQTLKSAGFAARRFASIGALFSSTIDVALVELRPGRGPEAVSELRAGLADVEVIATSAAASPEAVVDAMRRGASDFLERPIVPGALVAAVSRSVAKTRLVRENRALRLYFGRVGSPLPLEQHGPRMRATLASVERLAPLEGPVLIEGESGTGKEFIARSIHRLSPRAERAWLPVSCGSLVRELVDAELFGHEAGAYTDARERRLGLIEVAADGTLFLDEVAALPLEAQSRLLRFIESGEFRRLGGSRLLTAYVRILASTSRALDAEIRAGRFREDLYYRLAAFRVVLPPLRDRTEEIPAFMRHFLRQRGIEANAVDPGVWRALVAHSWPGNLRELRNVVDRLILRKPLANLTSDDVTAILASAGGEERDSSLAHVEEMHMRRVLALHGWNRTRAASVLGISVRALYTKIKALRLAPP